MSDKQPQTALFDPDRLTQDGLPTDCPCCHGDGVRTVGGYSTNPYSGVRVLDPQEAREVPCKNCAGTGRARIPF